MRYLSVVLLLTLKTGAVFAQVESDPLSREQIQSYDSRIEILENGQMDVVETIQVVALGQEIRRGIYRDFPTVYQTGFYTKVIVPFYVTRVLRDGQPEPYHTEEQLDGVRVYIGSASQYLEPGRYTYTIEYRTGRQLGFFDTFDELYWNVTGNQWSFPIERATATVILPPSVALDRVNLEAYTGAYGSSGRDYTASVDATRKEIHFAATRALDAFEGLTIVVQFPAGHVRRPTSQEQWQEFLSSNRLLLFGGIGLAFVLLYYLTVWILVGRDPDRGVIVPLFEPPLGLSPAGARYLYRMRYDPKCFAAALINLAVKGALKIKETDGVYTLTRTNGNAAGLSRGETNLLYTLIKGNSLKLTNKNHGPIGKAIRSFRKFLKAEFEGKHFLANQHWLVPGWMLSATTVVASVLLGATGVLLPAGFMLLWLSLWTLGVLALGRQVVNSWRRIMSGGASAADFVGAVLISAFSLPFFGGEVLGFWFLSQMLSIWVVPLVVLLVGVNYLFFHWIKRPTGPGRKLLDRIEGFRMFLAAAERDRLNFLTPPDTTPQLFEKYLPYALALGVENEWAQQFAGVLSTASTADAEPAYQPGWYSGSSFSTDRLAGFASGLGASLGGAVASSSTPPGSRSGGGGGGFSGGGGGGGGGGGW